MPEQWCVGVVNEDWVRMVDQSVFLGSSGNPSPAEMGTILLEANELDMYGSCMGGMMEPCTAPCPSVANCAF